MIQEIIVYGILVITIGYVFFLMYKNRSSPMKKTGCEGCSGCSLKEIKKNGCA